MQFTAPHLRVVLSVFVLSIIAAFAPAQDECIPVEEETKEETEEETGVDPEPDLNCNIAIFPRANVAAIIQSENIYPTGTARQRHLAKAYFRQGILETTGVLNNYWTSGVLAAIEFDWYLEDGRAPAGGYLPVRGVFEDAFGNAVCHMYCYDLAGFVARQAAVEADIGHQMYAQRVWSGATVRGTGSKETRISGNNNLVRGVISSADVEIGGNGNTVDDGLEYIDDVDVFSGNTTGTITQVSSIDALSTPWTVSEARAMAQSSGTYYSGDVFFGWWNPPPSGFVFAEGRVFICSWRQSATCTIAARGKIEVWGSYSDFTCHTDDALFVSFDKKVDIEGNCNDLEGEILAKKRVKIDGHGTTVHGVVQGSKVRIKSSSNHISDGTH